MAPSGASLLEFAYRFARAIQALLCKNCEISFDQESIRKAAAMDALGPRSEQNRHKQNDWF